MARRKRKMKKSLKFIVLLLLIGIIGTGGYFGYLYLDEHVFNNERDVKPGNNPVEKEPEEEEKEKVYKLSMLATGDGLIHSVIYRTYEVAGGGYDFTESMSEVKDIVKNYDLAYYNQETVFGGASLKFSGYSRFNTPSEFGDTMVNTGFNLVSLATNHTMDKGETGVLNSIEYWKTKKNVIWNGIASSKEERTTYQIGEKNNITYALLSYTTSTNGLPVPTGKSYLVNTYSEEKVKQDVKAIRDKVDVVMVAMHWGAEYIFSPNESQVAIANYLADLDVDIVIGTHPHVLQPVAYIDDTLVYYSLGNFISNQHGTRDYAMLVGFMATLDITKTVSDEETKIEIGNLGGELVYTYYGSDPTKTSDAYILQRKKHKVIPFSKMTDGTYNSDYERLYTKYTGILKNMEVELNIAPLPY